MSMIFSLCSEVYYLNPCHIPLNIQEMNKTDMHLNFCIFKYL